MPESLKKLCQIYATIMPDSKKLWLLGDNATFLAIILAQFFTAYMDLSSKPKRQHCMCYTRRFSDKCYIWLYGSRKF